MNPAKPTLRLWLIGLVTFAIVIALGVWLRQASDFGIVDHQLAGTAKRVNEIQGNWSDEGVRWLAILSMAGDLVFIGIYGLGSWVAARGFMRQSGAVVRIIGLVSAVAAVFFLATDYTETILQFIQLVQDAGDDRFARIAASMQQIKIASWTATFIGIAAAWAIMRFSTSDT